MPLKGETSALSERPLFLKSLGVRFLASDPGLIRLRMGLRVALTTALVAASLAAVHFWALALPAAAFVAGMTFAIQGAVAIRDGSPARRFVTRLLSAAGGFSVIGLCSLLAPYPRVVEAAFLLVVFIAVYLRRWGARWNAVGMFAFMACFAGAYLRPPLADLPAIAGAIVLSGVLAHLVREHLLADHPASDLRQALAGMDQRVGFVAGLIGKGRRDGWTAASRTRLLSAHQDVRDAMGMVEGMLPADFAQTEQNAGGPPLAVEIFDLNLALESAVALALFSSGANDGADQDLTLALRRLARLRRRLRRAASAVNERDLQPGKPPATSPRRSTPAASGWSDPDARLALQVTTACALAMAGGMWLSPDRWFWAVLTAFLVFTNVQSRGDTALRGLGRAGGTALGIVVGIALATLLHGLYAATLALGLVCVFLAFFFLQVSYGTMTFFMTVTVSLVYGLLGNVSPALLVLRLEETTVGALAGVFVSFLILPQRTSEATRKATALFIADLDRLMETVRDRLDGTASEWKVYAVSRSLDRRHAAVLAASRPLGRTLAAGRRRRSVRIGRLRCAVLAYWAHRLAAASAASIDDPEALRRAIETCRNALAGTTPENVFLQPASGLADTPSATRRAPSNEDDLDAVVALSAITHTLSQIARGSDARSSRDSWQPDEKPHRPSNRENPRTH